MTAIINPKELTLDDYQKFASKTAIYKGRGDVQGLNYVCLKLNGEAGEIAELMGKHFRDDADTFFDNITPQRRMRMIKEAGDALWYVSQLAHELGVTFGELALENIYKLQSRKDRGVLGGEGSER